MASFIDSFMVESTQDEGGYSAHDHGVYCAKDFASVDKLCDYKYVSLWVKMNVDIVTMNHDALLLLHFFLLLLTSLTGCN